LANSSLLNYGDKVAENFDKGLFSVLKDLDKRALEIVSQAKTGKNTFDAATILNSRGELVKALRDSGYNQVVEDYLKEYEGIPDVVAGSFKARGLPRPEYTTVDAETWSLMAKADFERLQLNGIKAVDELRLGLYQDAIAGQPFSAFVDRIQAATVGFDGKASVLRNQANAIANTAILNFGGEVVKQAGEAIGAEFWEVVGPNDSVTREECQRALAVPIRTKEEWMQAEGADGQPYWGGTPGGWNCRHQLFPVLRG
jgi:hypothetical protein